ncbi:MULTISPECIES: MHYT domain-containing protein [Rhodomicrobium]|uniref:MHYT domain-containing protein n=1 Tax=Rhodomicrobium TaxID=1068 RepID=UPI000B4B0ED9|nr:MULTISPECIES: MHYT domain-containing protein [Rhodomicrobium]
MGFTHDSGLVALSIAIAILGAFTGLIVTSGLRGATGPGARLQVGLGGLSFGGGFWAMQMIGILAVIAPVETGYSLGIAMLSILIGMLFTSAALAVMAKRMFGRYTLTASVIFLGSGLEVMHIVGVSGLRGAFVLSLWWPAIAVSTVIAGQVAFLVLWFAFRNRGLLETAVASIALGLAAASMHFAGMQAVSFLPAGSPLVPVPAGSAQGQLAFIIALVAYAVCGMSIFAFTILTFKRGMMRQRRPQVRLLS